MSTAASADITIALELAGDRVADVSIVPRRLPALGVLLAGRSVTDAFALLPRLFALCSTAHGVAAQTAVNAAHGIDASPTQQRRRNAALLAERLAEQLRGAVTALRILEQPAVADATRQAIRAAALFAPAAANDIPTLLREIDQIESALDQIGIADLQPAESGARFGSSGSLALTAANDLNVIARLVEGGARYAAAPDLDGIIPEAGAWARSRSTMAPDTPAARLRARLDELAAMPLKLRGLVTGDAPPYPDARIGYRLGDNLGAAAVETARGRLYHLVELDRDGRVARFDCLAPTEWNFHPHGPLARMLRGATLAADGQQAVEQLIAAFDPCVGTKLTIREVADA
jgi:coenzyme F420-reducing hydrogenase alpha subunit